LFLLLKLGESPPGKSPQRATSRFVIPAQAGTQHAAAENIEPGLSEHSVITGSPLFAGMTARARDDSAEYVARACYAGSPIPNDILKRCFLLLDRESAHRRALIITVKK